MTFPERRPNSLNWRRPGGDFEPGDAVTVTDTEATLAMPGRGLWRVRLQACNDAGCGPGRAREVALGQQPTLMGANGPAMGPAITLTGACTKITLTVQSSDALYVSTFLFKRSETGSTTSLGITNHDVGSTKVLNNLSPGEFIFGIRVHDTEDVFWAGPGTRNPDGLTHARSSGSTVSFEDWYGGGDEDFDDAVLLVTQANCDVSPPPQNTQNPPPQNTQNPPPDDTQNPPPQDTQNPPPQDTQNPPPQDTQNPPPEDTRTPPPENTQTEDTPHWRTRGLTRRVAPRAARLVARRAVRPAASPATAPRERQARPSPRSRRPPRRAGRASCRSLDQVDGPTAPPTHRTSQP